MMFMKKKMAWLTALSLIVFAFITAGCQKKAELPSEKLKVVVTLFPLYDFSKNIAGDRAQVSLLLPPGVEVHSFEPRPGDIIKMKEADIFIYTGDAMEPWVQRLLPSVGSDRLKVIDASKGIALAKIGPHDNEGDHGHHHEGEHEGEEDHHDHGDLDPHIWLDFANAQKMVDTIADGLAAKDTAHKELYGRNATAYKEKLASLDQRYRETLATCEKRHIIHGGHFAFNYLARRYGLEYESAYPGSPDTEPSVRRLVELRKKLKKHGLDTVYFEELINPRTAEVIAKETGSKLLKLHGAHNVTKEEMDQGVTFLQLMEHNLTSLRLGLKCTEK
ncbi:MAG: High-affinity zinc uptake system binding-protein ZnuA precursor [Syntrophorhabdaceae bacterium PtaU1.Bin034]|jgi:zinc transport system substrate-binding protein|nr:MAG: High-affinity zinc uptake system binding-protein ZnuA precursor [Syntrophorhabdaceae bacterium PtaU1.Bin034]